MAQPTITHETVRELVNDIIFRIIAKPHHRDDIDAKIEKWLNEHQPKQSVVGLTDKQVVDLAYDLSNGKNQIFACAISNWLKTQTFNDIEPVNPELSWYNVQPNFNKGFDEVTCCYYKLVYVNKYGDIVHTDSYSNNSINRPNPVPLVGQVWRDPSTEIEFTVTQVSPSISCYCHAGYVWDGVVDDFINKFEIV